MDRVDFGKTFYDMVYFRDILLAARFGVQRDAPHTPVTSLVKYQLLGGEFPNNKVAIFTF